MWLSPFFVSPTLDFGYDVADPGTVDPVFGTIADFDELLAAAHARGLRVLIDYVANHTSDQHPWFVDSRQGSGTRRRDWYVWAGRLIKDPTLADNPAEVAAMRTALEPGAERLGHIDLPGVHAVLRELRAVVAEYGADKLLIGEVGVADPVRRAAYYGDGDELDLPLNFAFWSAPFSADGFRRCCVCPAAHLSITARRSA